jgi:hypothetical protein
MHIFGCLPSASAIAEVPHFEASTIKIVAVSCLTITHEYYIIVINIFAIVGYLIANIDHQTNIFHHTLVSQNTLDNSLVLIRIFSILLDGNLLFN